MVDDCYARHMAMDQNYGTNDPGRRNFLDWDTINLNPKHKSYSEHSLKLVRKVSAWLPFEKKLEIHRKPIGFVYNLYANILRYGLLYGARIVPKSFFAQEEFIQPQQVNQVRNYCKADWEFIQSYADKK